MCPLWTVTEELLGMETPTDLMSKVFWVEENLVFFYMLSLMLGVFPKSLTHLSFGLSGTVSQIHPSH